MTRCLWLVLALVIAGAMGDFSFPSFTTADNTELQLISDASIGGGNLTLTSSLPAKVGATWYVADVTNPIGEYVLPGFRTTFTFFIDEVNGIGGDGVAFVIQSNSPYLQGTIGGGIGYGDYQNQNQGITDSIAFEFDTVQDPAMNDPNDNHCGVHSRGDQPNSSNEDYVILGLVNTTIPILQDPGKEHLVVIDYVAKDTSLTVELDGELVLSSNAFNLTDLIKVNDGDCYIGLTSSTTTTSYSRHAVTSWYFYSGNGTIDIPATIVYGPGLYSATLDQQAEFYLQLVDIYGRNATASGSSQGIFPVCNVTSASDPSDLTANCTMTDNMDGTYTATYTMSNLGSNNIYVSINDTLVGDSPYNIFITGPPAAAQTIASGPGTSSAVAGENTPFTITTYDAIGNPISEGGANFLIWLTGPQTVNGTITDNNDGTYSVTYNVTIAGDYTLNILLDNYQGVLNNIKDSPFDVTCVANVVNPAVSYAYGEGLTSATAGEEATFYVQAVDTWGNNATNPTVTWTISLDSGDFASGPNQTSLANGLYLITYEIDDEGDFVLTIQDGGVTVVNSPSNLSVVPGPPAADESELYTEIPPVVTTNTTERIIILAEDEFGNSNTVGGAMFTCSFSGPDNFAVNTTDNNNGTYTCEYEYSEPGDYTINIDLVSGGIDTGPIEDNPFAQQAVGPAYGPRCTASGAGLSSSTAGEIATFQVALYDKAGTPATTGDDVCQASLSGAANVPVNCVYSGSSNIYNGSYNATVAGSYQLSVNVNSQPIQNSPFTVSVGAGAFVPGFTRASGPGLTSDVAGESATFNLTLYDTWGNEVLINTDYSSDFQVTLTKGQATPVNGTVTFINPQKIYRAEYTLTSPTGPWNMEVTFQGASIVDSPFSPVLVAGAPDATACYITPRPNPDLPDARAFVEDSFNIQATDSYGNSITDSDLVFESEFKQNNYVVTSYSMWNSTAQLYTVEFTLEEDGDFQVTTRLNSTNQQIQTSPVGLTVQPGFPAANTTTASGQGLSSSSAGEMANFTIYTNDLGGKAVTTGGAIFSISMVLPNTTTIVNVTQTDNQDGTYLCTYNATVAGQYVLEVNMTNFYEGPIVGSPWNPMVKPGPSCPQDALVYGDGLHNATTNVTAEFYIQSSDCFGNPIDDSDVYYNVLIEGPDCTFGKSVYAGNGVTNVTYLVTEPGDYLIYVQEEGNNVKGSPFSLTVTGEGMGSSSSSSTAYMIAMIVFIILFVLVLLILIAYALYVNWGKIQKMVKKNDYDVLNSDSD